MDARRRKSLGLHETIHMGQEDRQCIVGSPVPWLRNRCTVVGLSGDRRIAIPAGQGCCWIFPESVNRRAFVHVISSPTVLYPTIDGPRVPPRLRISAAGESTHTGSCTGATWVTTSWMSRIPFQASSKETEARAHVLLSCKSILDETRSLLLETAPLPGLKANTSW